MKKEEKTEFEKFSDLTKRLVSVPKTEIDKRHKEWEKRKEQERQQRKAKSKKTT